MRPPKKSWKNIANLSGGEKTLSSLSLVFALHHFKPTPLYVMDEIDAALGELCSMCALLSHARVARVSLIEDVLAYESLWNDCSHCLLFSADFKNVSIVGHYIKERTKNAQFVIISLRNNMFELADRLVGIYKVRESSFKCTCNGELAVKGRKEILLAVFLFKEPLGCSLTLELFCKFADGQRNEKRGNQSCWVRCWTATAMWEQQSRKCSGADAAFNPAGGSCLTTT